MRPPSVTAHFNLRPLSPNHLPILQPEWPSPTYAKRPFAGPDHVLQYLGNYTHRVAISNRRLVGLENGKIHFRWCDSVHKNKKRITALSVEEFLRRFFLHVLPPGFVRIRHFGFLANRQRQRMLPLCRRLLTEF